MMTTPRFNLFYAGYTAYAPVQFYSKLSLVNTELTEEDVEVSKCFSKQKTALEDERAEFESYLVTAISIAKDFQLAVLPAPGNAVDYFNWLKHYTHLFESQFPMSRIEHYYFLYARKIAEISCSINLLKWYLCVREELGEKLDLSAKMEKELKDAEYILFKLVASAALLSSEPRQNYFNLFYRDLNLGFEAFRDLDVRAISDSENKALQTALDSYLIKIKDGFKKGIGLLKELQS